ncbi:MAG: amidohydrolase family protein [Bryobacteraceae bacterium]
MRIDAHQHFWDRDRFFYAWMPPEPSPLRRNFLPEDLKPILERNRFDASIAVQAAAQIEEAEWLLDLADDHTFVAGVVGWVDLTSPQVGKDLDRLQRRDKFKGVRHLVHDEADEKWLLRDDVIAGLGEVARRGLPYDLLLRPNHLPYILEVAERVPELRMVIDHIAKPLISKRVMDGWAEGMERAAQIPEMHVKLSGMITEADWKGWKPKDLVPYVEHVMRLFGPERLLFGSDWPVCLLAGSWKEVLAAFTQAVGPLPAETREKILGANARKFYGIAGL